MVCFVTATLLLVYSLPNVIGLRNMLTFAGFVLVAPLLFPLLKESSPDARRAVAMFGVVILWTLVVALFIADDPAASLAEWRGEWLPVILAFLFGFTAFDCVRAEPCDESGRRMWFAVVLPLCALMAAHILLVLVEFARAGAISPHFSGLSDHKANITYAASTLLPVVFGFALVQANRVLPFGRRFSALIVVAGLLGTAAAVTSGARNGVIVVALGIGGAGLAFLAITARRHYSVRVRAAFGIVLGLVVAGVLWGGVHWDPRWQAFVRTVPVALDTEQHQQWLDPPGSALPLSADGKSVEESAYQRIAWAKVGLAMLLEHPLGLEISRHTFRDLVIERYGRGAMSHAHSSVIDFGLNVGLPGLAIWFGFVATLIVAGWKATRGAADVAGWALIFLVLMYVVRSLVDSIMRDHILEQFILMSGVLLGASARNEKANRAGAR